MSYQRNEIISGKTFSGKTFTFHYLDRSLKYKCPVCKQWIKKRNYIQHTYTKECRCMSNEEIKVSDKLFDGQTFTYNYRDRNLKRRCQRCDELVANHEYAKHADTGHCKNLRHNGITIRKNYTKCDICDRNLDKGEKVNTHISNHHPKETVLAYYMGM